ncbi:MAG TPA: L,D-transpeptidase [Solirubrobacteraceae bacterium]|nr:L,D-transpeptidase [Solirubrobacteraceae bacterium]
MSGLRGLGRALVLVIVAVAAIGGPAASADSRGSTIDGRTQAVAVLLASHVVFSAVSDPESGEGTVDASRPITGERTVLPVVGRATGPGGAHWLEVMLPGRPNGGRGWIAERGTVLRSTSWRLVVRTSERRVLVYRYGRLVRTFAAIVGKPSTPTPHGEFFVEESVRMLPGSAGAPFALALSARSNTLQEFDGGPGQIAIHGVTGLGGILGTAVSHGCVRVANQSTRWLAGRIGRGVPVTVTS